MINGNHRSSSRAVYRTSTSEHIVFKANGGLNKEASDGRAGGTRLSPGRVDALGGRTASRTPPFKLLGDERRGPTGRVLDVAGITFSCRRQLQRQSTNVRSVGPGSKTPERARSRAEIYGFVPSPTTACRCSLTSFARRRPLAPAAPPRTSRRRTARTGAPCGLCRSRMPCPRLDTTSHNPSTRAPAAQDAAGTLSA